MKKWNTPEVTELNINETANGCIPFLFESCMTDNVLDNGKGEEKGESDTEQNS